MAAGEITGATQEQVEEMREEFQSTRMYQEHGIEFERAYCLREIGKQPDEYDGPQRYCKNRVAKLTEEEWNERYDEDYPPRSRHSNYGPRVLCKTCTFHGRHIDGRPETLRPYTANLKHGLYAEDEHLQMDFNESEQTLYDGIMEQWPEIYNWPPEEEDPARYEMLDMVASNVVRRRRAEDYLDDEGEVHFQSIYDEGVEVGEEPEENPLAGEYRLLMREITTMLKELGLTPKERAKQGTQEKSANALEAIGEAVRESVVDSDKEYDPSDFEEHHGSD